jgi:uncharacterized membrane protein
MPTIEDPSAHPQSTAKIGGHPIHPMLVPFPIVCFIGTFVLDLIYVRGSEDVARFSTWTLIVGLAFAALAAVAGLTDFAGDSRVRSTDAVKHMVANVLAVLIELANLVLRLRDPGSIGSAGVYLSGLVVLVLLYSGWKGGDLVYHHGIGVQDHRP